MDKEILRGIQSRRRNINCPTTTPLRIITKGTPWSSTFMIFHDLFAMIAEFALINVFHKSTVVWVRHIVKKLSVSIMY